MASLTDMISECFPEPFPKVFSIIDALIDCESDEECRQYLLECGKKYKGYSEWYKLKHGQHLRFGNQVRLNPLRPCQTITKSVGSVSLTHHMHWAERRRLMVPELKRCHSFPDLFRFHGDYRSIGFSLGNSVPPLFMRAIASSVASGLFGFHPPVTSLEPTMTYPEILDAAWADHLAPRRPDAPTVVSLFAGCGGSSLGFSMAGYRELFAVEWDKHAVRTFRENFHGVVLHEGDITKLSGDEALRLAGVKPGEVDVMQGSPPCQGFSTAGKRDMTDPRNQLYRDYVRLLQVFRPKAFVMENVSGLVKGKMKLIFADILRALKANGYQVRVKLMNAMYFQVPQNRQRLIFIGVRNDLSCPSDGTI